MSEKCLILVAMICFSQSVKKKKKSVTAKIGYFLVLSPLIAPILSILCIFHSPAICFLLSPLDSHVLSLSLSLSLFLRLTHFLC